MENYLITATAYCSNIVELHRQYLISWKIVDNQLDFMEHDWTRTFDNWMRDGFDLVLWLGPG